MDTKNFQEQYEAACWKIVDEMQDKFIDLCVDDNHSAYGNQMPQKHEQLKAHLEKLNFRFETNSLDLPAGMASESSAESATPDQMNMNAIQIADTTMGQDLDTIFNLLDGQAKEQFRCPEVIIQHRWNEQEKRFAD